MASGAKKLRLAAVAAKQKAIADSSDDHAESRKSNTTLQAAVSALKIKSPVDDVAAEPKNIARVNTTKKKLKAAALALKITGSTIPWGDFSYLTNETTDISSLSNTALKRHLTTRNEVAEGTKQVTSLPMSPPLPSPMSLNFLTNLLTGHLVGTNRSFVQLRRGGTPEEDRNRARARGEASQDR